MSKTCEVSGCERKHHAKGLCQKHYKRRTAAPVRSHQSTSTLGAQLTTDLMGGLAAHSVRGRVGRPLSEVFEEAIGASALRAQLTTNLMGGLAAHSVLGRVGRPLSEVFEEAIGASELGGWLAAANGGLAAHSVFGRVGRPLSEVFEEAIGASALRAQLTTNLMGGLAAHSVLGRVGRSLSEVVDEAIGASELGGWLAAANGGLAAHSVLGRPFSETALAAALRKGSAERYADMVNSALRASGAYPRVTPRSLDSAMQMPSEVTLPELPSGTSFSSAPTKEEKDRATLAIQLWITTTVTLKMAEMALTEPEQLALLFGLLTAMGVGKWIWMFSGRALRRLREGQDPGTEC